MCCRYDWLAHTAGDSPLCDPSGVGEWIMDKEQEELWEASLAHWEDTCAAMPPMSPEAIQVVAIILRRIDQRRVLTARSGGNR